jgi:hypothetical protein
MNDRNGGMTHGVMLSCLARTGSHADTVPLFHKDVVGVRPLHFKFRLLRAVI